MRVLGRAAVLACLLVFGVAVDAWAGVTHPLSGSFGAFSSPGSVAVDQASGDVLVVDRGANQVLRFDAAGNPVSFSALGTNVLDGAGGGDCAGTPADCDQTPQGAFAFDVSPGAEQVAVDNSGGPTNGDVYVTNSFWNVVNVFAADGRYLGQLTSSPHTGGFGETCGVAVDKTGAVYVAETSGWVHRYGPFSNPVSDVDFSSEFYAGACNLAVDSSGNLYANQLFSVVNKYSPAGDFQYTVDPSPAYGVAVDPATDNVYVAEGGQVAQYDASSAFAAALLGTFGSGQIGSPAGVAVDGTTNQVYVSDGTANDVAIFGAGIPTPDAATGAASSVTDTAATLNGTVNPNGIATTWQFEYGTDTSYGQTVPASPGDAGSGSADVPVSTDLSGLSAGAAYHYRLVAVGANGTSYGADQSFTTQGPPVIDGESASFGKTTATFQAQVNPFGLDTTYRFEYGTTASYGSSTPDTVIGAAQGDQPASADITGLAPNTTYHYRVVATNALGTVNGTDQTFTTQPVATIDREYVTGLSSSQATLNADINPLGDPTTYHFEIGTTTSYGTNAPATDAQVGAGNGDVTVNQQVSGLSADTVYHYRAIATNAFGAIQGADHTFRTRALEIAGDRCPSAGIRATEQASYLPDCRAYELVSPPEKNGGDISASSSRTRAAVDGNAVEFVSMAGFDDIHGSNSIANEYIAQRGSTGWLTHGIDPPQNPPVIPNWTSRYLGDFSDDLSTGVYFALSPVTNQDPNVAQLRNLYLRRNLLTEGLGSYQLLTGCTGCTSPLAPPPFSITTLDPQPAGTSADFRHVVFESPLNLTSEASGSDPKLYESVDGHVRLAGILPDSACGTPPCLPQGSVAGLGALNIHATDTGQYTPSTISADGSRVIFTAGPFTDPRDLGVPILGRAGDLYMRINGTTTIQLNASERTDCADHSPCSGTPEPDPTGHQPALYGVASRDGSEVFFMTAEALTDDAAVPALTNLYRYSLHASAGHHLTLITQDRDSSDDTSGGVRAAYVVGASDDGTYIYFWGTNRLLPTQPSVPDSRILYGWHQGVLHAIATDGGSQGFANWGDSGLSNTDRPYDVRVSPDGRHVLFATRNTETAQLTGFDNRNSHCSQGACMEIYLYDFVSDRLVCASCDPGEGQPVGDAGISSNSLDPTFITVTRHLNRAMSNDGSRVFFDTPDPLVTRDTNGKRDVYEYNAATRRVGLISSGHSGSDSLFVEATPSGDDVFFTTRERMVGVDRDDAVDLYDARVAGGIAAQSPSLPVPCTGDTCRLGGSGGPVAPVIGSLTFRTSGHMSPKAGVRFQVVKRVVRGTTLELVVRVPNAGRLSAHGSLVRPAHWSVPRGGTYTLRFRLTAHARRLLRHRRELRVRVRFAYHRANGRVRSVLISFRVKA